jgi:hypothetical protein
VLNSRGIFCDGTRQNAISKVLSQKNKLERRSGTFLSGFGITYHPSLTEFYATLSPGTFLERKIAVLSYYLDKAKTAGVGLGLTSEYPKTEQMQWTMIRT